MSEDIKQIARRLLEAMARRDLSTFDELMDERALYWVQGKPEICPFAGSRTKTEMRELLNLPDVFSDGPHLKFGWLTAEDGRVAVEVESFGTSLAGKSYTNTYHYLLHVADGKVTSVREYMDTAHAIDVFC